MADSADREGLDVELAASGFGQQHQQVSFMLFLRLLQYLQSSSFAWTAATPSVFFTCLDCCHSFSLLPMQSSLTAVTSHPGLPILSFPSVLSGACLQRHFAIIVLSVLAGRCLRCFASFYSLLKSEPVMVASVCLQMLDRYVQDSADNAHPNSEDGSSNNCSQADSASVSSEADSEADEEASAAADDSAHLARLSVDDSAVDNNAASGDNALSHSPAELDHQQRVTAAEPGLDQEPQMAPSDRQEDSEALPEQLPVDLPDHVAIRARPNGPRAVSHSEAEADLNDSSVMSHSVQIPSQAAVKQKVLEQQRSRMRRHVLAKASRNAQKVGNKKERKQTADSVNW